MKSIFTIEGIYKLFVILAVTAIILTISIEGFAANPVEGNPTEQPEAKIWENADEFEVYKFNEAQFLTRVNYTYAKEFLWLCDNSAYIPTVHNWNLFIKNYKRFLDAKRAIDRGFTVELDDLLN